MNAMSFAKSLSSMASQFFLEWNSSLPLPAWWHEMRIGLDIKMTTPKPLLMLSATTSSFF
jgi:hypothetical protein